MTETRPVILSSADAVADRIVEALEGRIVLGLPLGLGKANRIANALYRRAAADPAIRLDIYTALTLEPPSWSSDLECRFVEPLVQRLFAGYERLDYAAALRAGDMPDNVTVSEFFLLAGKWLSVPEAQQAYMSANYTHAAGYMLDRGINCITQLVSQAGEGADARYSLSCNTDITLDLLPVVNRREGRFLMVGETNAALPFMGGEAALPADRFDLVLHTPGEEPALFATPKEPVSSADHAIGIHAASLVKDGGTLQIGIGSLGDAVTAALILRHEEPALFAEVLARLCHGTVPEGRETGRFETGLYAASEMFVDGFAELYRAGILRRKAADGALLHSGFFLGSAGFYQFLRELPEEERDLFQMRGISFVNELYGNEARKRADRTDARFVNTAMMATLTGDVVSDGLDDGRVVSGVGGQYNFVAQAFALEGARSIITLNATRRAKGKRVSRLLWSYGHTTIPRHLRDMVVTEYGVADLRGRSDRDCIAAMLAIADAAFQDELLSRARDVGKVEPGLHPPDAAKRNIAATIEAALEPARESGWCRTFPFGTDFTPEEQRLLPALAWLRDNTATKGAMAATVWSALTSGGEEQRHERELARMGLEIPSGWRERIARRLVGHALAQSSAYV
ncbi:MAG: acetyl-CoA hydrolase [Rhizobiaceae bacterium]|nr:acetyl-CoA hydrolase [Rhizobiaceae bacterium]MCV0408991.1 acetyl-CoA hydrolase [Rhizobiaceae bacterium]